MRFLDRFLTRFHCYLYPQWGGIKMLKTALYDYLPAEREKQSGIWGMLVERNLLTTPGIENSSWFKATFAGAMANTVQKEPALFFTEVTRFLNSRNHQKTLPSSHSCCQHFRVAQTRRRQSVTRSGRKRARGWRSASTPSRGGAGRGGCARSRLPGRRPPCHAAQAPATTVTPAAARLPTSGISSRFTMMLLGKSYQNSAVVYLIDEALYDVWEMQ